MFTPQSSALLLIDHQVGTMKLIKTLSLERVMTNTLALAKTAKILNIPVVLTSSQEERVQGPLIPELKELLPQAFEERVQRQGVVNAWNDPHFLAAVRRTGRKQLIMAGVTTDVCLIFPSISATEDGFEVQAVMDASGSPFEISEQLAQERMRKAGVVLTTTNTLMAELAVDWSGEAGGPLLEVLFGEVLPKVFG